MRTAISPRLAIRSFFITWYAGPLMENAAYHMNFCEVSKAAVPRWCLRGQCGFIHKVFHGYQSSASLDEGSDMSAGRYFVSGGLGKVFGGRWRLGASVGYGEALPGSPLAPALPLGSASLCPSKATPEYSTELRSSGYLI